MNTHNESLEAKDICDLVRTLSIQQLSALLNSPPLGIDILEHAAFCTRCGEAVERAGTFEFNNLTTEQKTEFRKIGREIANSMHLGMLRSETRATVTKPSGMMPRFAVEPWRPGPQVALAAGGAEPEPVEKLVVKMDVLSAIGLQPYVRLDLIQAEDNTAVRIRVQRVQDVSRPGRYVEPKKRKIHFSLIRPSETIRVELGSGPANGPFRDFVQKRLKKYVRGEEQSWQAEVRILPG